MYRKLLLLFVLFCFQESKAQQACPIGTLGQTPATAFPVCGTSTFTQGSVNLCGNTVVPVPACNNGTIYTDINPYWYRFTCYTAGTLSFLITPTNLNDDYDWQLFDITGHDPAEVYTNTSLFVCCNWSGVYGLTGTADTASKSNQCSSTTTYATGGVSPFSAMPTLILGHTYILLVSHYTNTQSGYQLSFTGKGTASITDPNIPGYTNASGICGGDKIYIKLTKRVQCKTIAANGSDFAISPANVTITGASGYSCLTSFDTDSIVVQLNNPLPPANYSIIQQIGSDANTLLDNCNNPVAVGTNANFTITSQQLIKAGFTYQLNYGCIYDTLHLFLGGQNIVSWTWTFDQSSTSQAQNPVLIYSTYGQKTIQLFAYNSVCADTMATTLQLINAPIKAIFTAPEFACPFDTISFTNNSTGPIKQWYWDFGNGQTSTQPFPANQWYPPSASINNYPIRLSVTDSIGCSDTTYRLIKVAPNCYIAVASAFTPNGDGLNDYLYPLNAYRASNLLFRVFNRYGQIIFETTDWTKKWDGNFKGMKQASGTYVWTLDYTDNVTQKRISQKGTTVLIR